MKQPGTLVVYYDLQLKTRYPYVATDRWGFVRSFQEKPKALVGKVYQVWDSETGNSDLLTQVDLENTVWIDTLVYYPALETHEQQN